ncbi:tabserin-like isoform X2 [Onthophagus taurus]|uniref:tabserin-like isoform X2 n=1 Tax=Onthophagus taurus TaxID=166361 RepID=UPI0039BDE143
MLIRVLTLFSFWLYLIGCNDVDRNVTKRIAAGYTAFKGQYPYQVAILHAADGLICGGSIITQKWVLSAAHCFDRGKAHWKYRILAGDAQKFSEQTIEVFKIFKHEKYNKYTMDYDIALLRLQSELIFGSKVHGIKLSRRRIKKGRRCSMLGWETCAFHESVPYSTLRKIRLKTISNRRCLKYFRKTFDIKNNVSKRQLCAIPKCTNKKVTFCRADNGSPLVYRKRQVGILSHPSDELCTKTPSIFTRISPYFKWINRKIYKADKYEKITAYKHTNPTPDDFDEVTSSTKTTTLSTSRKDKDKLTLNQKIKYIQKIDKKKSM